MHIVGRGPAAHGAHPAGKMSAKRSARMQQGSRGHVRCKGPCDGGPRAEEQGQSGFELVALLGTY